MICTDSDFIIDFLKGKDNAVKTMQKYKREIVTTEVSKFEVLFGIYIKKDINSEEEKFARLFFDSLEALPFDHGCGEEAARILALLNKKGEVIEQNDCFIAAIMKRHGCDNIITGNIKHFERVKGLKVLRY